MGIPEQGIDRTRQIAPYPVSLAFRPPLMEQVKGVDDMPSAPYGPGDIPDQQETSISQLVESATQESASAAQSPEFADQESLHAIRSPELEKIAQPELYSQKRPQEPYITEPVETDAPEAAIALTRDDGAHQRNEIEEPAASQTEEEQKRSESLDPSVEIVTAKRRRGSIQEQPVDADQAQSASLPPRKAHKNDQEKRVSTGADAHTGGTDQEALSADALFAPRGTDRSPQAWVARLMGAASAAMTAPGVELTRKQKDVQMQGSDSEQTANEPQAATNNQLTRNGGIPPSGERPRVVKPRTDGVRKLEAGKRPPTSGVTNIVRNDGQARAAATPLSLRARQFLRPLVGIDPASVRVYRDAIAERQADAYQADAITIGDDVAMAAGHPDDTPETLGLLAHELTHVARLREPRFIPPVVRARSSSPSDITNVPDAGVLGRPSVPSDEEALAQRVESRVTRAARQQIGQAALPSIVPASVEPPAGTKSSALAARTAPDTWGGLPAPWEPLPDWLMSMPVTIEDNGHLAAAPSQPSQAAYGTASMEGSKWNDSTPGDGGVQRAGVERSLGEDEVREEQPPPDTAQAPQPDLDELARQVYSHLKRRLEVERRREG